ncbi:transcriptional regulator with XRE-family HTH domain [Friedmanniella endophytica]|uniref:Transcriptional regulator with XRE-family HTH domain n=1 Tax=Microlunatus kandeliicorticis TaxID=1759536 RepID=A0A7W3P574_9ACTN|nr:helix-turn-helix transcriptional regulator [Microlunatus kandeliicorticis]MBA8793666.1 transcriptional regulator with XRE-family HTH domain [Microlunatus kandeliicorticis]
MNERLRSQMKRRGYSPGRLARACDVNIKTVERWIAHDRIPHRETRWAVARELDADEVYLWPGLLDDQDDSQRQGTVESELLGVYPDRASVPRDVWVQLLGSATRHIDFLVYAGTSMANLNPRIGAMLAERAAAGVSVRLCWGDPDSQAVDVRDREEGLRGTLAAKIRASLTYYRELMDVDNVEIRLHGTTLYASIFRFDDTMLVNPHMWGAPASANPTLHLRRLEGSTWFDGYRRSFDAVWDTAQIWEPA